MSKASGVTFISTTLTELQKLMEDKHTPIRECSNPDHKGLISWCMQHQRDICLYCNQYYANTQHEIIQEWLHEDRLKIVKGLIAKGDYPKGDYDHIEEEGLKHTP
jgi:hypothetical protein